MDDTSKSLPEFRIDAVSARRVESLIQELSKRVMVVNEDSLSHLMQRGVIAVAARDGCCKPDGGTCCPNARTRIVDIVGGPGNARER
jgi:hypothetical protein